MINKKQIEHALNKSVTFSNIFNQLNDDDQNEILAKHFASIMTAVQKLTQEAIDELPDTYSSDISADVFDTKRLYVDFDKPIIVPCPECGNDCEFEHEYLGEGDTTFNFYCPDPKIEGEEYNGCGHEWEVHPKDTTAYLVVTL